MRQKATQMCLSVCTTTNGGDAFSITTNAGANAPNSAAGVTTCQYDFLLVAGAVDIATNTVADRFCGNALNPTAAAGGVLNSVQICSKFENTRRLSVHAYS